MTDPVYINKDAEYLHTLGATYIEDGDFEAGMRLQSIARHLAALDEKVANFDGISAFERGKREAFQEFYDRSNIPVSDRVAPMPAQRMGIGALVPVRKIPTGLTAPKEERPKKVSVRAEKLAKLGLKLNLNF